jgi:sec-independent protein translocase protein TatA
MPNWIGVPELIIILVIILLLFGAKRLPEIAKSLGKSVRDFKKSMSDITGDEDATKGPAAKNEETKKGGVAPDERKE